MDEDFQNELTARWNEPLLKDMGLTKYQHIERLGNEEVDGLLDGEVIVESKIDGANVTVAWDPDKYGLVIASRNQPVYHSGETINAFNGAVAYILAHPGIQKLVQNGWILRAEWLVRHTIVYDAAKHGHLYVFDVQTKDGTYLHPDEYIPRLQEAGVNYVPVASRLTKPAVDQLVELSKGPDEFGAPQKEGIVIKRYDFHNKYGRSVWAKIVSKDFQEKNKLEFGAGKADAPEVRFVANIITREFILKTIHKMEEGAENPAYPNLPGTAKLAIKKMPEVLGRVWHDAFQEELWDFVRKGHVRSFDFQAAMRMATEKTRQTALAYFNGIPEIEIR